MTVCGVPVKLRFIKGLESDGEPCAGLCNPYPTAIDLDHAIREHRIVVPVLMHELNHSLEALCGIRFFPMPVYDDGDAEQERSATKAHELVLDMHSQRWFEILLHNRFCFDPDHYPKEQRRKW